MQSHASAVCILASNTDRESAGAPLATAWHVNCQLGHVHVLTGTAHLELPAELPATGDDSSPLVIIGLSRDFSIFLDAVFFQDHSTTRACRIRGRQAKV